MNNWGFKIPEKVAEEITDFLANFGFNFGVMALSFFIGMFFLFFLEAGLTILFAYFLREYIKNH